MMNNDGFATYRLASQQQQTAHAAVPPRRKAHIDFSGRVAAPRFWAEVRHELERKAGFYDTPASKRKRQQTEEVARHRARAFELCRFEAYRNGAPLACDDVVQPGDELVLRRTPLSRLPSTITPEDVERAFLRRCLYYGAPRHVDYTGCDPNDQDALVQRWLAHNDLFWQQEMEQQQRYNVDTWKMAQIETTERFAEPLHPDLVVSSQPSRTTPPATYECYRCRRRGDHFYNECPTLADANWQMKRAPSGIPRSCLRVAQPHEQSSAPYYDPQRPGVFLVRTIGAA